MLDRLAIGNLFYRSSGTSPQIVKKQNTTQYSDKSLNNAKTPKNQLFFLPTNNIKPAWKIARTGSSAHPTKVIFFLWGRRPALFPRICSKEMRARGLLAKAVRQKLFATTHLGISRQGQTTVWQDEKYSDRAVD